jgi:hypothetical protein
VGEERGEGCEKDIWRIGAGTAMEKRIFSFHGALLICGFFFLKKK